MTINTNEAGERIRNRRIEMGLTAQHVAKFTDLPIDAIIALEEGPAEFVDQEHMKTVRVMLGVDAQGLPAKGLSNALSMTARNISTSYRQIVRPEILSEILRTGVAPECYYPHLMYLLDETPLALALQAAWKASTPEVATEQILDHLAAWARKWNSHRKVWY